MVAKGALIYKFSFAIHFLIFFLFFRGEFNSPASNFGNVHPSDVLDMPVDPNEPTYCLCHQVSYGEMIGCDNTDVSVRVSVAAVFFISEHDRLWFLLTSHSFSVG